MAPRAGNALQWSTLIVCAMTCSMTGCSLVAAKQDWQFNHANHRRAADAWKCCYTKEQRKCLSGDFEAGFKTGYFDTATGRDCRLPPVAPTKYWAAKYQCCSGQQAIQDWFSGYQYGISAAQSSGYPSFHEIPVSVAAPVTNRTACGMCQSCEPCQCGVQGSLPGGAMEIVPQSVSWDAGQFQSRNSGPRANEMCEPSGQLSTSGGLPSPPSMAEASPAQSGSQGLNVGLIGGFGADEIVLIGPVDSELFQDVNSTTVRPATVQQ